jgi:hypothetical protein
MGTSYYKLRAPGRVVVERPVTKAQAAVAEAAYTHGLGEFAAVNRLPVPHEVAFDVELTDDVPRRWRRQGARRCCRSAAARTPRWRWSSSPRPPRWRSTRPTPSATSPAPPGVPLIGSAAGWTRCWPSAPRQGGLNGHVPVTAINSAISTLVAVLGGFDPVVFANERSADEETLTVNGARVNHQYSKSYEFERLFAAAAAEVGVGYFSLTRQLSSSRRSPRSRTSRSSAARSSAATGRTRRRTWAARPPSAGACTATSACSPTSASRSS